MINYYQLDPKPKPRMTQRDKWKPSAAAKRYFAFKDECKLKGVYVPRFGAHVIFHVPMPTSWSKNKKQLMVGQPHEQRPDVDNLKKAIMDAIYAEDSGVFDMRVSKFWAYFGFIEVRV